MLDTPNPKGKDSTDAHPDPMLAHFLSALDVRIKSLDFEIDERGKPILDEVRDRLANFPLVGSEHSTWNEAYRLERLLALIEPASRLLGELTRRTQEAIEEGVPSATRLKETLEDAKKTLVDSAQPPKLRSDAVAAARLLLLDALEEIHWSAQRKFYGRPLQKAATSRTINVGILTFFLFLAPYLYIYFHHVLPEKNDGPFLPFSWFPAYTALTAGLFGAFFSRLMSLQSSGNNLTLGVLKDARNWSSILSRGVVGMCGALIVFFFLQSKLLGGTLFPDFGELGLAITKWPHEAANGPRIDGFHWLLILPNQQLALLVVWSFLAGFSERLVPNVLASTEKTLSDAINKK